jgi:hypothetical protein
MEIKNSMGDSSAEDSLIKRLSPLTYDVDLSDITLTSIPKGLKVQGDFNLGEVRLLPNLFDSESDPKKVKKDA